MSFGSVSLEIVFYLELSYFSYCCYHQAGFSVFNSLPQTQTKTSFLFPSFTTAEIIWNFQRVFAKYQEIVYTKISILLGFWVLFYLLSWDTFISPRGQKQIDDPLAWNFFLTYSFLGKGIHWEMTHERKYRAWEHICGRGRNNTQSHWGVSITETPLPLSFGICDARSSRSPLLPYKNIALHHSFSQKIKCPTRYHFTLLIYTGDKFLGQCSQWWNQGEVGEREIINEAILMIYVWGW